VASLATTRAKTSMRRPRAHIGCVPRTTIILPLPKACCSGTARQVPSTVSEDDLQTVLDAKVQEYVTGQGGNKFIRKVLVANNGISAVKAIRSIRQWSYDTFGSEKAIQFLVMATPEVRAASTDRTHAAPNPTNAAPWHLRSGRVWPALC
jgi:hypothetical protein